jgi:hypothetical protein
MTRQYVYILLTAACHLHISVVYQVQDLLLYLPQSIRSLESIVNAENAEQTPCPNRTGLRRA